MSRLVLNSIWNKNKRRTLVVSLLAGILCAVAAWRYVHPRIQTATWRQVEAVVPNQLLETDVRDYPAEGRLNDAYLAVQPFDTKEMSNVTGSHWAEGQTKWMRYADTIWNDGRFLKILKVLDSGPIHLLPPELRAQGQAHVALRDPNELQSKFKLIAKGLSDSVSLYRENGDYIQARFCLNALIRLDERTWTLHGNILQFYGAASIDSLTSRTIENFARDPLTPVGDCSDLLRTFKAPPLIDTLLAQCIRTEFQQVILPMLPDPFKDFTDLRQSQDDISQQADPTSLAFKTTYDAVATSTILGRIYEIEMANALRPLSQFNDAAERIERKAGVGLPSRPPLEELSQANRQWEFLKYRIATYNTKNFYGRLMISLTHDDRNLVDRSDYCRAMRNAVRILLATRIYRSSHGGSLPKDEHELVPYLGVWPTDPFDGRPFRYSHFHKVAYSIGRNLKDDGGILTNAGFESPDIGVQLTLAR